MFIRRTDVEAETSIIGHLMQRTDSFKKTLTTRAPPPAWEGSCHGELGGLFCEAAEAQEGAAGLIIPKNAAEEQKLKLERLMKNPVRRGAG